MDGIIFPYSPESTCSCVKLTLSLRLQYLGHIYQYWLSGELPYFIALSYEPLCSSSIFSFSASVNITGWRFILDGQILEYDLNLSSFSVKNNVGSCSRNFLKKGDGLAIFLPVKSVNSSSITPPSLDSSFSWTSSCSSSSCKKKSMSPSSSSSNSPISSSPTIISSNSISSAFNSSPNSISFCATISSINFSVFIARFLQS